MCGGVGLMYTTLRRKALKDNVPICTPMSVLPPAKVNCRLRPWFNTCGNQNRPTPPPQCTTLHTPQLPEVIDNALDFRYDKFHKNKNLLSMYQNRLPQQCACFVRVNPIRTKHFILDKSYLKVYLIILRGSHFASPIPRSL